MKGVANIERAGHELRVSFRVTPAAPERARGLPERRWPPAPPEFEIEKIELQWSIPDDLGPDAKAQRPIWLDITDLLLEVGGDDFTDGAQDEILDRLANEDDGGPPSEYPEGERDYPDYPTDRSPV